MIILATEQSKSSDHGSHGSKVELRAKALIRIQADNQGEGDTATNVQ